MTKSDNKTILVVEVIEDEPSIRHPLVTKLKLEGYRVLEAENGQTGLDLAVAEHPDLILLDVVMPVMDGQAMVQNLRKDAWGKDAKVIILTNLEDSQTVLKSLEGGVPDVLVKADWKLADIVDAIKAKLS